MIETDPWAHAISMKIWNTPHHYRNRLSYEPLEIGENDEVCLLPLYRFRLFLGKFYRKVKYHSM